MLSDDGTVEFAGQRMRPDLAGEMVEVELMVEAMERAGRYRAEHGGNAACGCPLRIDGTEPYLHRDGCPRQGDLQIERWLREYGGGGHAA